MYTILITGIFGTIGQQVANELLKNRYYIIGFDLKNRRTLKRYKSFIKENHQYINNFTQYWGDLTKIDQIKRIFEENIINSVIHLAFIIPPLSELKPELAYNVNINGTKLLMELVSNFDKDARFIFTSSVATYGTHSPDDPLITINDDLKSFNQYSNHKIHLENLIRSSTLNWTIVKFSAVMYPKMEISLESRDYAKSILPNTKVQPVHIDDLAIAIRNLLLKPETTFKSFIIAGSEKNRTHYGNYITKMLSAYRPISENDIPWEKFEAKPYYLHWYDTTESEKILHYQYKTIDDCVEEMKKAIPFWQKLFAKIMKSRFIAFSLNL